MNITIRKKAEVSEEKPASFRNYAQSFWTDDPPPPEDKPSQSQGSPSIVDYVGGSFKGTFTNKEIELDKQSDGLNTDAQQNIDEADPFDLRKGDKSDDDGYVDFSKYNGLFKK